VKAFIAYSSHDARHCVDVDLNICWSRKVCSLKEVLVVSCWLSEYGEHPRFESIVVDTSSNELWESIRVCDAQKMIREAYKVDDVIRTVIDAT